MSKRKDRHVESVSKAIKKKKSNEIDVKQITMVVEQVLKQIHANDFSESESASSECSSCSSSGSDLTMHGHITVKNSTGNALSTPFKPREETSSAANLQIAIREQFELDVAMKKTKVNTIDDIVNGTIKVFIGSSMVTIDTEACVFLASPFTAYFEVSDEIRKCVPWSLMYAYESTTRSKCWI